MRPSLLALLLLGFVCLAPVAAQTPARPGLINQLLDLPAPPAAPAQTRAHPKPERPDEFYEARNRPPDDAPLADLLDYWDRQNRNFNEFRYNQQPSAQTLERILAAAEDEPALLTNYLKLLPADPAIATRVRRLYENAVAEETPPDWLTSVRGWLRGNSDMFLGELIDEVRKIKVNDGRIEDQDSLISLAKIDWDRALPFVEAFENDRERAEIYTLAVYVRYHRALRTGDESGAGRLREGLRRLVADRAGSYKTRDLAMDALVLGGDFPGRDEWYFSLLADESLLALQENGYTGLTTLVSHLPAGREKWLASMIELLASPKAHLRSVAVRNLYQIDGFKKKEVLVLLLPWLADPDWAKESRDDERESFIDALGEVSVPECVPGLIALLQKGDDEHREEAAIALVTYKSPAAVPVLRRLLMTEEDEDFRETLVKAIYENGGFSDDEQMTALEKFATRLARRRAAGEDDDEAEAPDQNPALRWESEFGSHLFEVDEPSDGLARRTIARRRALARTDPATAAVLQEILDGWESPIIDLDNLGRLEREKANVGLVLKMLARCAELAERIPEDLRARRARGALTRVFGSICLDDRQDLAGIMQSGDAALKTHLLALARLVRAPLAVAEVAASLKSADPLLALAAARYLEAEDSAEARTLLLAERRGAASILGARQGFAPLEKENFAALEEPLDGLFASVSQMRYRVLDLAALVERENALRDELRRDQNLVAVYGFIESDDVESKILRVYRDRIVYTYNEDEARYWTRTVAPAEYEALLGAIVGQGVDRFSSLERDRDGDAASGEFLMFGRDGGRRVFFRGYGVPDELEALEAMFDAFNRGDRRLHYRLAGHIAGLEVLFADDDYPVRAVWKNGADLRLLADDQTARQTLDEELTKQQKLEEKNRILEGSSDYSYRETQRERRAAAAFRPLSWRRLLNGRLTETAVAQPSAVDYLAPGRRGVVIGNQYAFAAEPRAFGRRAADFELQTQPEQYGELVKLTADGTLTMLKEGNYQHPFVTPDARWAVVAKAERGFYVPNGVVRTELSSGREFPVKLPPADDFYPLAYLAAQDKMLLYRARDENGETNKENPSPAAPEYYLLDPSTGATQPVKGEFRPLKDQTYRGLQPVAGAPDEFWAAVYDEKAKATLVGRYHARAFAFRPLIKLPTVELDSMDIWADEPAARLYFVYRGHLLAVPLGAAAQKP